MTATESKEPDKARLRDRFVGATIADKYKIVAPIARGGMGRVYRAVQVALDREVAIKLLDVGELMSGRSRKASGDAFRQRFLLEAASCAKLNHPNTVVIHDYGSVVDDVYYIAMELLRGKTLLELIESEGPIDYRRIVHIALQICDSVGDAHNNGLVHRDLKPSNVMVLHRQGDPNYVKVLDFGLVKRAHEDDSELTQSGAMVGTPRYMPPEQIERDEVTPASDVYSLGACLYHALAGRPPFEAESKFALMMAHLESEPRRLSDVSDNEVPAEIEEVLRRCMRKDPRERYQTMGELSSALVAASTPYDPLARSAASWRPIATPSGRFRRPTAAEAAGFNQLTNELKTPVIDVSVDSAETPPRRGIPWLAAGALVALTLLGSLALRAMPTGETSSALTPGVPIDPIAQARQVSTTSRADARPRSFDSPSAIATRDEEPSVQRSGLDEDGSRASATTPDDVSPASDRADEQAATDSAKSETKAEAPTRTPVAAKRSVRVQTDPPGVSVFHQGMDLGDTPLTILIPEGETWSLELSAAGYRSRTIRVDAEQGELVVRLRKPAPKPEKRRVSKETVEKTPAAQPAPAPVQKRRTDNRDPWSEGL